MSGLLASLVRVRDRGRGSAQAAALQRDTNLAINLAPGTPHFGMRGEPALSFTGYVASPQSFIGQAQLGKSRRVSVQQYPALPNTEAPAAQQTWLQDWDALEGVT